MACTLLFGCSSEKNSSPAASAVSESPAIGSEAAENSENSSESSVSESNSESESSASSAVSTVTSDDPEDDMDEEQHTTDSALYGTFYNDEDGLAYISFSESASASGNISCTGLNIETLSFTDGSFVTDFEIEDGNILEITLNEDEDIDLKYSLEDSGKTLVLTDPTSGSTVTLYRVE